MYIWGSVGRDERSLSSSLFEKFSMTESLEQLGIQWRVSVLVPLPIYSTVLLEKQPAELLAPDIGIGYRLLRNSQIFAKGQYD